ncbi:MAG: type IV pilus twitching motility protein PilT [Armatimonadetes bacterium]|nr:type IV pilus twitching motility protein PilT [Armatimonadota bacterium]
MAGTHSRFDLDTAAADGYPVTLNQLLTEMVSIDGSDLHLRAGEPPIYRVHGHLTRQKYPLLTSDVIRAMCVGIMNEEQRYRFEENLEIDLSHFVEGVARFRVNVFHQRRQCGSVMRQIPVDIKNIDQLGLPPVLKEIAMLPRGLVLVTGPTGSGKSTTLAAMIKHVNEQRARHIVTIEDPIEFVHEDIKCTVEQRELGMDTHSFQHALRHVLRQNPDIVLVGEMRDLETISLAITVAETGHLVFGTLHTTDASQTVDRIIDVFSPEQQSQIRMQLSIVLQAVVSQTLLPRTSGGRIAAHEILVVLPSVRALIREAKTFQIPSVIQAGAEQGMISLDQTLLGLLQQGEIKYDDALLKCSNTVDFVNRAMKLNLVPPEHLQEANATAGEQKKE